MVVFVSFSDRQFTDSDPVAAWNPIFNQPDYNESPFYGSVHDYFDAQSGGQLDLSFDLLYVPLGESAVKYRSTSSNDENSQYLVNDVVDVLLTKDIDWGQYDWNGDGYVNQLIIIYPGYGMNDGGGTNSIWPHQWWLSQHRKDYNSGSYQTGTYCEPRQVTSGGHNYYVDCYCALQECANSKVYGSFGTIIHEYSHCFGFPDVYVSSDKVVGAWDLMDFGNNNQNGFCPPNYSAHERSLMGWLTPVELTETSTITDLPSLSEGQKAYIVRNDAYPNEFYMVENRQPVGWDLPY